MSIRSWFQYLRHSTLSNHRTLVLNADGLPLGYPFHRLNGQRTLRALAMERVEVVTWSNTWVNGVNRRYQMPSVVRLKQQVGAINLGHVPLLSLQKLYLRDKGLCQYTGEALRLGSPNPEVQATIDHVVSRSKGGPNTWENVVLASSALNNRKRSLSVQEAGLTLLAPPYTPTVADLLINWLEEDRLFDAPADWRAAIDVQRVLEYAQPYMGAPQAA